MDRTFEDAGPSRQCLKPHEDRPPVILTYL